MARKTFVNGEVLTDTDINTYLTNETTLTSSTGTAYAVLTSDRYKTLVFSPATAGTVTIGTATAFQAGERVDIIQDGTAVVRIAASGVTLAGAGSTAAAFEIAEQDNGCSVICVDTDEYRIIGKASVV